MLLTCQRLRGVYARHRARFPDLHKCADSVRTQYEGWETEFAHALHEYKIACHRPNPTASEVHHCTPPPGVPTASSVEPPPTSATATVSSPYRSWSPGAGASARVATTKARRASCSPPSSRPNEPTLTANTVAGGPYNVTESAPFTTPWG